MENYKEKLPRYLMHEAENKGGELAHAIKEYKDCIEILQSIKRVHKKDGSDFQNLRKNFDTPESVRIGRWFCVFSKYAQVNARRDGESHKIQLEYHNTEDEPTADEIEAEIKKHIEKYKGRLADAENDAQKFGGEAWVRKIPLEKEMATHSSTLAWKIPWMEEPGRLQSMGLQRVGHE